MQTKVLKKKPSGPGPALRCAVERQLSWAAVEGERIQHRDPLARVTEQFQQTFDQIGLRRAAQMAAAESTRDQQAQAETKQAGARPEPSRTPIQTFAGMAFQRGRLVTAVLQGTGRVMLATCLQHAAGQHNPLQNRQVLFGAGSQVRAVPGSAPDQMVFHRGFAQSAVGLVVDTLSDAKSVVDTLAEMASGAGALEEKEGALTLRRVYPFLDDSRERELLDQYRARLAGTTGVEERQLLQNAMVHAGALITRKAQMRQEFATRLQLLSDRAREALEELQQEDTLDEMTAAVAQASQPPEIPPENPPEDGGPEGPGGNPPNRSRQTPGEKEAPPHGTQQPDGKEQPEGIRPEPNPQPAAGTGS